MIELLARAFGGGRSEKPKAGKRINLALQGGGALGAFTWGVLDHLLEDGRLTIEGISGASAGAVNAAILADGLARGGPEAARKRLADFWRAASLGGNLPDLQRRAVDRLFSFWPIEDTPIGLWMQAMTRYLSPYDFNPLNINPLKDLVGRFVDFEAVRAPRICNCLCLRPTSGPESCAYSDAMK
jgi:NTE family protein